MDRDEALRLLKGGSQGVEEWSRRRGAGEEIPALNGADLRGAVLQRADLRGVGLRGAVLRGAILRRAYLSQADLSDANLGPAAPHAAGLSEANLTVSDLSPTVLRAADLSGADLRRAYLGLADLRGAVLNQADLSGAILNRADLSGADLSGADLSGADLREADFSEAGLSGADLSGAACVATNFAGVDLSCVDGLEAVFHDGPSMISTDTLFQSQGKIPEAFLRGCGVPETLIEYLPSLIGGMQPIQFNSCFISYSTKNEAFAKRLHSRMVQEKLRVWFAPEDVQGGKKLHEQIDEAIRVYDKLLLVLSRHSMGSEWVKTEIRKARKAEIQEGRRKLFPIRLVPFEAIRDWECFDADSGKDLGVEIREYYIPDFTDWKNHDAFEAAFARLIKDLEAPASTGEGPGRESPPKALASTSGETKGRGRKGRPKRP
jgi:uncharacterized protein YjbI with pentapeptide repeats